MSDLKRKLVLSPNARQDFNDNLVYDELRHGLRSYQVRQHVVYSRVEPAAIRVDRILHRGMDAARRLGE